MARKKKGNRTTVGVLSEEAQEFLVNQAYNIYYRARDLYFSGVPLDQVLEQERKEQEELTMIARSYT